MSMNHFAFIILATLMLCNVIPEAAAKRFDCRLFCKETGFHGMLGGCRCSFTLFTAKRALREPMEEEGIARILSHIMPKYNSLDHRQNDEQPNQNEQRYGLNLIRDNMKHTSLLQTQDENQARPASRLAAVLPELDNGNTLHRLDQKGIAFEAGSDRPSAIHNYIPVHNDNPKRREFEMDLDNGETADFLRMPY